MSGTHEILDRLIAFDTVSATSNLPMIDHVEDFLARRGFWLTRITDPAAPAEAPKAGLYAEIGPAGPGVLLSAHSDVVPVAGQDWTRPPFRLTRDGGRLFGRGTTDMKGFVACMLAAADRASRMPLGEPLKLVLSYDEEIGCVGMARMLNRLVPLIGQPRLAIVGEPTVMQVATGHKGKRSFRALVHGQAGHSALAPRFVNALHIGTDFIRALQDLQAEIAISGPRDPAYDIPYSTVHVGLFSGGRALNIVPDRAEVTFEIRHLAADDPDALMLRIEAAAAAVCDSYPDAAAIEIVPLSGYPGLNTPDDDPAVANVEALAGRGRTKVAFGTEAGFLAGLGIPTVVCGPGSMAEQGHKADEYIEADQLAQCDAMLDRLLHQML